MLPLGTSAPAFTLPDISTGQPVSLGNFAEAKVLVIIFLCNHCPYVIHIRSELARIARDYVGRPVALVGISSNDAAAYPDDSPEATRPLATLLGFPILHDETQAVAKAYTAACTPDFFLFDAERKLAYRGQLDGTRPRQDEPTGADLRAAIDAVLSGTPLPPDQKPSLGCNIKWKPGNEPDYFQLA